ncbi:MAG: hypothetical protein HKO59_00790 [Phycisphaerales bacterium]|nr:hypothetical protein [Phycisphaerales bacterium]
MRSVAPGYRITRTPTPAAAIDGRVRWADIPAAARAACREAEIAVVAATANADATAWTFSLRTIEDWPGTLHVERRPPPDHYAATASIGRFPDLPERRVRAEAVLDQLREKLLAYGRKRSWDETEGDAADASITTGSSAASERAAPASPPR